MWKRSGLSSIKIEILLIELRFLRWQIYINWCWSSERPRHPLFERGPIWERSRSDPFNSYRRRLLRRSDHSEGVFVGARGLKQLRIAIKVMVHTPLCENRRTTVFTSILAVACKRWALSRAMSLTLVITRIFPWYFWPVKSIQNPPGWWFLQSGFAVRFAM